MQDAATLRTKIHDAFASVPRPRADAIAPHRCQECDALRDALAPYTVDALPVTVLKDHVFDLPLLSAEAKQYYLPAWLLASLNGESWNYVDAAIANIDSNERFDPAGGYTDAQWEAILSWLSFIEQTEEEVTQESACSAGIALRKRREA